VADPTASGELDAVIRALRDPSHEEMHQVRRIVELAACQLSAELVTRSEIKRMRSNLENIENQARANAALPWPRFLEIHFLIVQAARNRLLSSIYELIMQVLKRKQVPFLPFIADWQSEVDAHRRLIDVLEQGDPEAMAEEMAQHLEHSEKYRLDLLEYQARSGSIIMNDQ
jgi:DNA-binding FadR family transcriptional regulator